MRISSFVIMQVVHPSKQKFITTLVAGLVSLFGLEAASLALSFNEVSSFLRISFYLYLFLVVWQVFIFDLHLKKGNLRALRERFSYLAEKSHWLHFLNYLILPAIIYWATVPVIYLNPFGLKENQVWILLSALGLTISFWYLKHVFYAHRENRGLPRELIFITKLYASFVAFAAGLGLIRYFDYEQNGGALFALLAFCITFLLLYQALFQHHFVGFKMLPFLASSSLLLAALGYAVYYLWNVNYFSGALVLTAVYNTIWGYIHHKYLDEDLNREIVYEYLAVLFLVLVIVFSTTNFAERI